MGKEKAPFDDQKWNERLKKKVMADLEKKLDENEKLLEEAENQRILKLKLMGVYNNGSDCNEDSTTSKVRHHHKPHKKTAAEKEFEKRNRTARESVFKPGDDIETQMEILHRDESQVKRRTRNSNSSGTYSNYSNNNQNDGEEDCKSSGTSTETPQEDQTRDDNNDTLQDLNVPVKTKEVPQRLKKLFEEEDLQQLYKEAETLVGAAPKTSQK